MAEESTKGGTLDPAVARICAELSDPRMIRVVVEKAACKTLDEISASVGVDVSTIRRWRTEHPLDALASQLAAEWATESMREGVLVLKNAFADAARTVVQLAREGESENVRLIASKAVMQTALGVAIAELEASQREAHGGRGGGNRRKASDLSHEELMAAARDVAKRRKQK